MSRRHKGIIVSEVKVPADIPKMIPHDPVGVVKSRISYPIVLNTGKFVITHEDTKSHDICMVVVRGGRCLPTCPITCCAYRLD